MKYTSLYLLIFCCVSAFITQAQNNVWVIRGKVVETNQAPLEFVNVYVNNTSIGTTTKVDGSFMLNVPKSIQKIEIVVSFIGFNTIKKVLSPQEINKNVVFFLENSNVLKEVKITAKRDKDWKKKWKIFKEGLLGNSMFTDDCEILNPETIRLEYDQNKNVIATSNEPIYIQNNGLGYKIMFQMEAFSSDGRLTFSAGDKFFEQLKPKDAKQENRWNKFRKRAYRDSFRNFLVSLSQNKLEENGFEVFKASKLKEFYLGRTSVNRELNDSLLFKCTSKEICRYDSLTKRFILHSDKPLLVFLTKHFNPLPVYSDYPYKFSQIALTKGTVEFTYNGWITKPNKMILRDHWGNEGLSSLLPDDYETFIEETTPETLAAVYSENEQKYWLITGKVLGTNGLPVESAEVYVNHTENGVKTSSEGKFSLKVPIALQQLDLLITHPKFYTAKESINAKENTAIHQIELRPDNFSTTNEKGQDFQKNWKVFTKSLLGDPKALLGKTLFAENCEISNPEVINFDNNETKKITATANKPLIIKNNAIGYKITYQLNNFESDGKEHTLSGDKFFEKLTPQDEKQLQVWKKNQLKLYQETLKYFLISISQNKLEENGFAVFKMLRIMDRYDLSVTVKSQLADSSLIACKAIDLCKFDPETNRFYLYSDFPLLVFLTNRTEAVRLTFSDYPYKRSQIVLPNFYLEFAADGTITNFKNAEMRDFWGNDGLSGSLPNDFSLDKETIDKISLETIEVITPKSIAHIDSSNRFLNNGIIFNRTQIEIPKEKSYLSVPTDFNVRIHEQDNNLTIYDLLRRIPGLIVKFNPKSGNYFVGFSNSMSFQGGPQPVALSIDNYFTDDSELISTLLNSLNVREINSLGVVKYGNASSYGARGGNGVVVITTKK